MTDLGTLGGATSEAMAINDAGQIVGFSDTATGERRAFLWESGSMMDLGVLPGGFESEAWGINNAGQVVGSSDTASGDTHGFVWEAGFMVDVDVPEGLHSEAYGINSAGQIVGRGHNGESAFVATLWEAPRPHHTVGLVNTNSGKWSLRAADGTVTTLFYGVAGDLPIVGDWDGDGVETVGMYRQSNGLVYLRNSNTTGPGEREFILGNPGDIPLAGDFNGDGNDTVSVYRPSQGRVYIANSLAPDGGVLVADYAYFFGIPGDKPFVGDFNNDGTETVGLYRDTTGLVYFTDAVNPGGAAPTDNQFHYGLSSDRLVSGDWTGDGTHTMGIFRPSDTQFYLRYTNTVGVANEVFSFGNSNWLPIAGDMGL